MRCEAKILGVVLLATVCVCAITADPTTFATGFGAAAGCAVGPDDQLYIADQGKHNVYKVTNPGGAVSKFAGTGIMGLVDGVAAMSDRFIAPTGLFVTSSGDVLVADVGLSNGNSGSIRNITGNIVTTILGTGIVSRASGIVEDSKGNLFIADMFGHCIWKLDASNSFAASIFAGSATNTAGLANGVGSSTLRSTLRLTRRTTSTLPIAATTRFD